MDLVRWMGKNVTNQSKTRCLVLDIKFENGFPTEKTIRELFRARNIDDGLISFSDDYGLKSPSKIHWKSNEIDKSIESMIKFMEFNRIKTNGMKLTGEIHSISFTQQ